MRPSSHRSHHYYDDGRYDDEQPDADEVGRLRAEHAFEMSTLEKQLPSNSPVSNALSCAPLHRIQDRGASSLWQAARTRPSA